ncbi:hypothetical protein IAT38_002194 [Cryptococcus sp. DSM 104549]
MADEDYEDLSSGVIDGGAVFEGGGKGHMAASEEGNVVPEPQAPDTPGQAPTPSMAAAPINPERSVQPAESLAAAPATSSPPATLVPPDASTLLPAPTLRHARTRLLPRTISSPYPSTSLPSIATPQRSPGTINLTTVFTHIPQRHPALLFRLLTAMVPVIRYILQVLEDPETSYRAMVAVYDRILPFRRRARSLEEDDGVVNGQEMLGGWVEEDSEGGELQPPRMMSAEPVEDGEGAGEGDGETEPEETGLPDQEVQAPVARTTDEDDAAAEITKLTEDDTPQTVTDINVPPVIPSDPSPVSHLPATPSFLSNDPRSFSIARPSFASLIGKDPGLIKQIFDELDRLIDPRVSCRVSRDLYNKRIGTIYRRVVLDKNTAAKIMRGYTLRAIRGKEVWTVICERKARALQTVKIIGWMDLEATKAFDDVFRRRRKYPSSMEEREMLAEVRHVQYGRDLIMTVGQQLAADSPDRIAKRYWSWFADKLVHEIGPKPLSLCFELLTAPDLVPYSPSTPIPVPTHTVRAVDILSFKDVPWLASDPSSRRYSHCTLHLLFDNARPIPVIYLDIAYEAELRYDLYIPPTDAPRQFIRAMWRHFCLARSRPPSTGRGVRVPLKVRYVIPERQNLYERMEAFWMDECEGGWARDVYERFQASIIIGRERGSLGWCPCMEKPMGAKR